ncbi:hypothetical protein HQ489_06015 [Candidatus Woesearchaeota archaeon]|nr:hypothetical protein [Candidatus Woesearchaeota archaeon]
MNQKDLEQLLKPKRKFTQGSLTPYTTLAQDKEIIGEDESIKTVITRNSATNRILVYGEHINDGAVFSGLNLSIGMAIGYRNPSELHFYKHVEFKEGKIFGKPQEYIGLVNIVTEDLDIIDYNPN